MSPSWTCRRPVPPDPFTRFFSRYTLIVGVCLAATVALAWLWLVRQAAADDAMAMAMPAMIGDVWSAAYLVSAFTMWLLMMVAMMLPSAALMILFYVRYAHRAELDHPGVASTLFVSAYVAVWALFSLAAALLQALLVSAGTVSAMALAIGDRGLAGALLILAGLYQLNPLKQACLGRCRSPLDFVVRLWRPGPWGAVRLGLVHGLYCLGCCWALMLLLFVGGVMNLAWIALLALMVMAEKFAPPSLRVEGVLAALLLTAGAVLILSPLWSGAPA